MLSILENIFLYGALLLYVIITDFWIYKLKNTENCSNKVDIKDTFDPVDTTTYTIESVFLDAKQSLLISEEKATLQEPIQLNKNNTINAPFIYSESVPSDEQHSFFEQLAYSINESVEAKTAIETVNVNMPIYEEEPHEAIGDMLSMEAWRSEPEPIEELQQLAVTGTSKINEHHLGEQLWIVEVVGEEQGYLHVSDGSGRAWIDFNAYNGMVARKDKLSIRVNRISDVQVELIHAEMLQQHSLDFCMTEELIYHASEEQEAISA